MWRVLKESKLRKKRDNIINGMNWLNKVIKRGRGGLNVHGQREKYVTRNELNGQEGRTILQKRAATEPPSDLFIPLDSHQ
jgi:hypothetical protein